uniref:Uncharacterized protein n=1 Tax=Caenorhabditis tropicalis TaxID=1561998 RepID=A0A1I7UAP6_9PELO
MANTLSEKQGARFTAVLFKFIHFGNELPPPGIIVVSSHTSSSSSTLSPPPRTKQNHLAESGCHRQH